MPAPRWPRPTRPAAGSRETTPGTAAEQYADDAQALRRKIADLQAQQKETIQRLSRQTSSVEEIGVALARLEQEIARAKEQLSRMLYQNPQ